MEEQFKWEPIILNVNVRGRNTDCGIEQRYDSEKQEFYYFVCMTEFEECTEFPLRIDDTTGQFKFTDPTTPQELMNAEQEISDKILARDA